jgi:hypothetical protein
MSFSTSHRNQNSDAHSTDYGSFKELPELTQDFYPAQDHVIREDQDPLVERILDFLDKYPSQLTQGTTLTGCMRAC